MQSNVEGVSKPDPAIFAVVLERLGVEGREAVFLDDLGSNLKSARSMGMTTIKAWVWSPFCRQIAFDFFAFLGN